MTAPRPTSPRIEPLTELTGDAEELVGTLITGPDGKPINIFATLAKHPKMAKRFNLFGGFLLNKGLVPAREREIVILRVGWNARAVYEFGQHTINGRNCGLSATEIKALATDDPSAGDWSSDDQALIAVADDLCRDDCVSDATFAQHDFVDPSRRYASGPGQRVLADAQRRKKLLEEYFARMDVR